MIVTDIISIDKRKSKIFVEEQLFCALYNGEIRQLDIRVNNQISEDSLMKIQDILAKRARERSFYILKTRDHTEKEMRDKLKKSYVPENIINSTIEFLHRYSYIDDERYTRNFVEAHSRRESIRIIKGKLLTKGINREIIESVFADNISDPCEVIRRNYSRKIEQYQNLNQKGRQRIYNMLLRKGFSYEDINNVLRNSN